MQLPRSLRRPALVTGRMLVASLLALSLATPALATPAERGDDRRGAAAKDASRKDRPAKGPGSKTTKAAEKKPARGDKNDKKDAQKGDKKGGKDKPKAPLSIGAPNRGRLAGGVKLSPSTHLQVREGARAWGLPVLVQTLRRASDKVAKKHPRSVLLVGDLSARPGGVLDGHNSHQTGRDADVGFYVTNSRGKPVPMKRFVAFNAEGVGIGTPWARFDDARNWALVEALLEDKSAGVRYLFISVPLRARLLAFAAKKKVSKDLQARAAIAMLSPKDADLHDDHFHVRVTCPAEMRGTCVEEAVPRPGPSDAPATDPAEPAPPGDVAHAEPADGAEHAAGQAPQGTAPAPLADVYP